MILDESNPSYLETVGLMSPVRVGHVVAVVVCFVSFLFFVVVFSYVCLYWPVDRVCVPIVIVTDVVVAGFVIILVGGVGDRVGGCLSRRH